MTAYQFSAGESPLLVSMPHVGTGVPEAIREWMTADARCLPDTDWYVNRLYDFLPERNVSVLQAHYSRYVIDLNRSPRGESLYPGKSVTELCPTTLFDNEPIYRPNYRLTTEEIERRVRCYWQPYHDKLQVELARIKQRFGYALLWDAHSIRSRVPRFFEGVLPDFNWGTGDGASCSPALAKKLLATSAGYEGCSSVLNGRFKGGYITRTYGNPSAHVHAVQLELSQALYMSDEENHLFSEEKAKILKARLGHLIESLLDFFSSRQDGAKHCGKFD